MIDWAPAIAVATILWALYMWRRKKFRYFREMGIPGPEPSLIFGNLLEIRRLGATKLFEEWIKKYGNIVGFYNGSNPFLLVNDLDLAKKIEIEDFKNFAARGVLIDVEQLPEIREKLLVNAPVDRWREMRAVLSPAFTTKKLSQLSVIMMECIDTLIRLLEKRHVAGKSVEVTLAFRLANLDTMLKAGYGVDLEVQNSPPGGPIEELATSVGRLLQAVPLSGITFLANCFPELRYLWFLLTWVTSRLAIPSIGFCSKLIQPVINQRKSQQMQERMDVLQLLLNKEGTGELFQSEEKVNEFEGRKNIALTKEEVVANSALFLLAGLEATPSTISMTLYLLASHPKVQDRLRQEIMAVLKRDGTLTQKNVLEMTYLSMVLNESMRLYSPITGFITRRAANDYEYKGVKIPKGLSIMIPISYMHYDPDVWEQPEAFDPERFSPENKAHIDPTSFQPFGKGPRECIGRNFALLQIKLSLCKFLAAFSVSVDTERHKEPIKMSSSLITSFAPNGVWLKLEKMKP